MDQMDVCAQKDVEGSIQSLTFCILHGLACGLSHCFYQTGLAVRGIVTHSETGRALYSYRCGPFIMKSCILIFVFGLTITSRGQSIDEVQKRLSLLTQAEKVKYDTTGFSKLPESKYFCTSDIVIIEKDSTETIVPSETEDPWKYYTVIDLNDDDLNDLIYSGPCLPYDQTGVFVNDGKTLKLIHDYPGKVVSLEKSVDKSVINVLKESCCCDYYSDYIQVTIWNDSHIDKNQITFFGNTEIKVDKVTKLKIKGILRTSPEVNDKKMKDDCSDQIIDGNHLAHIDKPTTVVQLSQSGQWRLILYPVDNENSYIGWIK